MVGFDENILEKYGNELAASCPWNALVRITLSI